MEQLYEIDEDGNLRELRLFGLCEWWIETYPEDIFINEPKEIVEIRNLMKKILEKRKK